MASAITSGLCFIFQKPYLVYFVSLRDILLRQGFVIINQAKSKDIGAINARIDLYQMTIISPQKGIRRTSI